MKNYSGRRGTILRIGLLLLCGISSLRFFDSPDYWLFDILSHFSVQYAFMALVFLIVFIRKRSVLLMLTAGLLFIINISVLADVVKPAQAELHRNEFFSVCSANISKNNTSYARLVHVLIDTDADILLLLEVTETHVKSLDTLIKKYPFSIINLNKRFSGTGTVLLSRFPIVYHKLTHYSDFGNMLVAATLQINDEEIAFYGVHFPRPRFEQVWPARSTQFVSLADQIAGQTLPVVVAGDFNATPYAPIFQKMMKISGLKDSRSGFGWQPSWPTYFPPFWIPIDHILVGSDIQVHKRSTGSFMGSDHYPVFAELSLR